MFVTALRDAYGPGIGAAVARQLSLRPAPGRPLEARDVGRALEAAETSQQAIAGVDYLTLLRHSACADSREFRDAAQELGIDTATLGADLRRKLDDALRRRFEEARAAGAAPLSAETAKALLQNALHLLTG